MKDMEIIKALDCCGNGVFFEGYELPCKKCPYEGKVGCETDLEKDALNLITRQKAEIERLKSWVLAFTNEVIIDGNNYYIKELSYEVITNNAKKCKAELKAEAIKEFAERLKEEASFECDVSLGYGRPCYEDAVPIIAIDNLVKEMVGDV